MNKKYFCLCCGYNTLDEEPPGTFQICKICNWEDDLSDGGANKLSLKEAKERFRKYNITKEQFKNYMRHPHWENLNYSNTK